MKLFSKIFNFFSKLFRRDPDIIVVPCKSEIFTKEVLQYDLDQYHDKQDGAYAWIVYGRHPDQTHNLQWFWSQEPEIEIEIQEAIKADAAAQAFLENKIEKAPEGTLKEALQTILEYQKILNDSKS